MLKRSSAPREAPYRADVVVVGAGIVGAACADQLAAAGLAVTVVERGAIGAGTTGAGEGNLLVSDKEPGPELALALLSHGLWDQLGDELGPTIALERKSGIVVATGEAELAGLHRLAAGQEAAGVRVERLGAGQARSLEPYLTPDLAGAVRYPQDMQVQPVLAAAALLRRARGRGAVLHTATTVTGVDRDRSGRVCGVRTDAGRVAAGWVVNAAGLGAAGIAALAGSHLPIEPRRGFILVTEPLPPVVRAKVYDAGYVSNVSSDDEGLQTSTVVEATDGGTILIGASRERVGLDPAFRIDVLASLARQAVRLFPVLAGVHVMRAYRGFRPYSPDHLPVIGADPAVPGLVHAAGHEGAGIGLAPATGLLVRQLVTGEPPAVDPTPFRPDRPALTAAGGVPAPPGGAPRVPGPGPSRAAA
nr:FAD-binding oxidoreductase [Micromonospora sp. DSM 115978]